MSDEAEIDDTQRPLEGAGARLRNARQQQGKSLDDIVEITRIQKRHLEAIEAEDFASLPSRTYAVGFSRNYARVLDLNQEEIADQVRGELATSDPYVRNMVSNFEPGDPARVPSRGLAWFSAFAGLLLIAGGLAYFGDRIFPGQGPWPLVDDTAPEDASIDASHDGALNENSDAVIAEPAVDPTGEVVFTALDDEVWVKFYDRYGNRMMERQMARGERYVVPRDVDGPQVWTGRPDALAITIGGQSIPPLGEANTIVRDVPVTAEALLARVPPAPQQDNAMQSN